MCIYSCINLYIEAISLKNDGRLKSSWANQDPNVSSPYYFRITRNIKKNGVTQKITPQNSHLTIVESMKL